MDSNGVHVETRRDQVGARLPEILAIANNEKEALGFLPEAAYRDAIDQGRIYAALSEDSRLLGYIFFGGVFPHARIQQIGVHSSARRTGIASSLMRMLLGQLETEGFLTVQAKVASELAIAHAFYATHGFEAGQAIAGGESRARTIIVRTRHLESPSLLDAGGKAIDWSDRRSLTLRRFTATGPPFYVIDLNVLFDLVRNRARSVDAHHLFGAALAHTLRIAVADEFVAELKRTSHSPANDPILKLALQLPRLPKVDGDQLEARASEIHKAIFEVSGSPAAGSAQALSDSRHLAHAALAAAAGFITSDGELLAAHKMLLSAHGIDVANLDDLISLLPPDAPRQNVSSSGEGFSFGALAASDVQKHLRSVGASQSQAEEYCRETGLPNSSEHYCILESDAVVAVGALLHPKSIDAPTKILVQVPQNHRLAELFADHLFDVLLSRASSKGPAAIQLSKVPGQTLITRAAEARGFFSDQGQLTKVALGRPVSPSTWHVVSNQVRRRVGLEIPRLEECFPTAGVVDAAGTTHALSAEALEQLLAPTIIAWPGREGVIVSIRREWADELLGTSSQTTLSFIQSRAAFFLARRAYVSSPRNAPLMRSGLPILFYESERSGGRGGIVAAGRVTDGLIQAKEAVSPEDRKRIVVDNLDPFSSSPEVLVTTFENIIRFPAPVDRKKLRSINALGSNNFQAATPISAENLCKVLDAAWCISG